MALLCPLVQAFLEKGIGSPTRFLRSVKCKICVSEQGASIGPVIRRDRNSNAGGRDELITANSDGRSDRLKNVTCKSVDSFAVLANVPQNHEFIAPEATDELASCGSTKTLRHFNQHLVTFWVTQSVVDDLEIIKIEAEECEGAFLPL